MPALLVAVLAGCGDGQVGSAAPASTPVATPAPLDLGFASFTFRMDIGDGESLKGSGTFRNAPTPLSALTLDDMVVNGKQEPGVRVVQDGKSTFVQSRAWAAESPALAGRWIRAAGKADGLDPIFLQTVGSYEGLTDPYQQLQMLQSGLVDTVGSGTVDGVAVTHKRSTVTLQQLWDNPHISAKIRDAMRAVGLTAADLADSNVFDAWIDADGHVVKFEWTDPNDGSEPIFVTSTSFDRAAAAALATPDPDTVLDRWKVATLGRLTKKINAGTATAAEIARARALCKELGLGTGAGTPVRST